MDCTSSSLFQGSHRLWVGVFYLLRTQHKFPISLPKPQAGSYIYTCYPSCSSVLHLMLLLPAKVCIQEASASIYKASWSRRAGLIHSLKLLAPPFSVVCKAKQIPKQHLENFYIWAPFGFALQSFQFVRLNCWRLSFQLGERKAVPTASERAASLRSAWHQRRCRPLSAEQKHMVPHLASSLKRSTYTYLSTMIISVPLPYNGTKKIVV